MFEKKKIERGGREINLSNRVRKAFERFKDNKLKEHELMAKKHPKALAALDRLKEHFDFGVLNDIIREYLIKSGVKPENLNSVPIEDILINSSDINDNHAAYSAELNIIIFHPTTLEKLDKTYDLSRLLIHEAIHAASYIRIKHSSVRKSIKIGYDHEWGGALTKLVGFNEGVTELMAQEILLEYYRREGYGTKDAQGSLDNIALSNRYKFYMWTVKSIAHRLDIYAGIEAGTSWKAIIRGALEGEDLQNPEFSKFFEALFPKGFFDRYANFINSSSDEEMDEILNDFNVEISKMDIPASKLDRLLEHFGIRYIPKEKWFQGERA